MLETHGTQIPIYATCEPSWWPLAIFPIGGKMTRKWGRMATYPKLGDSQLSLREERPHRGNTPFDASLRALSELPLLSVKWRMQPRGENQGEKGLVAILGKTAKIPPKVVTPKIVSPYHKRKEPRGSAWMQTEALLPFCNKG